MAMNRDQDELNLVTAVKKSLLEAAKEAADGGLAPAALQYVTAYTALQYGKLPGEQPAGKS